MIVNADRYANWKAPSADGQLLVWPDPQALLRETDENAKSLARSEALVQGLPVSQLRSSIRSWLGHGEQPLVATGHQTELYHPGVWVKDAAINTIADRVGGTAFHFAVDTDQPKHLSVRWPGSAIPISDDPSIASADWSGLLAAPTPAHLTAIESALSTAAQNWNFTPMLGEVLTSLRKSALEEIGLSAAITAAQHQLDWSLGLKHHAMLVSPMLFSQPYLIFVHHVLSRAAEFAADYNASLADYRSEAGITSAMRPMPDLHVSGSAVEVPFWLDDLATGTRSRAEVRRLKDQWVLSAKGAEFVLDPAAAGEAVSGDLESWLRLNQLRLSPRALTLTTFLRLLVVDQFIHGIGGGRYDQVTDRLLVRHFKIDPPRFAIATGTLFFPGAVGRSRVCMPCVQQEGHRLKHSILGDKKRLIVDGINAMPRKSIQRLLAFHNMHGALSAAAAHHPALKEWSDRWELTQKQEREELVIFDRELFYAMQTRDRLTGLIDQLNNHFK
jgi:hypothetical protein